MAYYYAMHQIAYTKRKMQEDPEYRSRHRVYCLRSKYYKGDPLECVKYLFGEATYKRRGRYSFTEMAAMKTLDI